MKNLNDLFSDIVSGIVKTAGIQVASAPEVKEAIATAQDQYAKLERVAWISAAVAGAVVVFYYVPRFESPIPRVLRRKRS